MGPGRWGTTSPAFGVPVTFAEIRGVAVICELALMHEGLVPDVSLGTHFFNDLVERDILYLGLFPEREGYCLHDATLAALPNHLAELLPHASEWANVVRVLDPADLGKARRLLLHADSVKQQAICFIDEATP